MTDKTMQTFRAGGRVIDRRTRTGIAGLRLEAWDKAGLCQDLVACAFTDEDGGFEIALQRSNLERLGLGVRSALFFRVFAEDRLIAATQDSVVWRVRDEGAQLSIPVDLEERAGEERPEPFSVRGRVVDAVAGPLPGIDVQVFDRNLGGSESLLDRVATDARGHFRITYDVKRLGRPGKQKADLAVRAFDSRGAEIASAFICHAPATTVVELVVGGEVYRGPSEYELLMAALAPALDRIWPGDLRDEEIPLAACTTGSDRGHVELLVAAHRLSGDIAVSPQVLYGLLRAGLPRERTDLLLRGPAAHRRAIGHALEDHLIPAMTSAEIDAAVAALEAAAIQLSLAPGTAGAGSLGGLLATVLPKPPEQEEIVRAYLQHQGPIEDFWHNLSAHPLFYKAVEPLQLAFQLGALTRYHLPLVTRLQADRENERWRSLRDLAKLREADWLSLLDEVGAPAGVPGSNDDERKQSYAKVLAGTMAAAFPAAALSTRLAGEPLADAKRFLSEKEDFEFGKVRVGAYLASNPSALAEAADPMVTADQLTAMERLYKITPDVNEIEILIDAGIGSAQSMVMMGKKSFQQEFGSKFGPDQINLLFAGAQQVCASAHALAGKYHGSFNSLSIYALPQVQDGQTADWVTLFGSLDFCRCTHCQSVYSPAAYLVDLLQFLDRQSSNQLAATPKFRWNTFQQQFLPISLSFRPVRDLLLDRRPDIARIELTCENAETPLPYVDLVNEILEYAVANTSLQPDVPFASHIATEGTPAELAAHPQPLPSQTVYDTAYDLLAASPYPWGLPLNLWAEEARVYLEHLGAPRYQLMEAFRAQPPDEAFEAQVAAEHLGISSPDRQILNGNTPSPAWELWGLAQSSNQVTDPADPQGPKVTGSWISVLKHVSVLLQRGGLDYEGLLALLRTRFINPSGQLVITSADADDPGTCKLSKLRIPNLDATVLGRMQRFLRLRRLTGWTILELDKALAAFGSQIDDALLVKLSKIERLRSEIRIPRVDLLAWWSPLDTFSAEGEKEKSLYERLFLNKAVTNPIDPAFELNADRTDLEDVTQTIDAHGGPVLAALRLRAGDLALLTGALPDQQLNLANLSHLFRHASLARALRLPVRDLLLLLAITGIDPFDPADLGAAGRLIDKAAKVRKARISLAHLDYLLRHVSSPASDAAPAPALIEKVLSGINSGLSAILADTTIAADPNEPLANKLARALPGGAVEDALALIEGTSQLPEPDQEDIVDEQLAAFLDPDDAKTKLVGEGAQLETLEERLAYVLPPLDLYLNLQEKLGRLLEAATVAAALAVISGTSQDSAADQEAFIEQHFAAFLDPQEAKANLVGAAALPTRKTRMLSVLQPLLLHLRRLLSDRLVRQKLGEALKLEADTIEILLTRVLQAQADPSRMAMVDFTPGVEPALTPTADQQRASFVRLHKAAALIRAFKITAEELLLLFVEHPPAGWLDLNTLPLTPAVSGGALFAVWERLADLIRFRNGLRAGKGALAEIVRIHATGLDGEGQPVDFLTELAGRTGWALEDLQQLAGPGGAFTTDFQTLPLDLQLGRLAGAWAPLKRIGVSAETALPWTAAAPTQAEMRAIAASIKSSAKAKYDEDAWPEIARPLRDVLRDKQRAALSSFLVWKRNYADSGQLFAELLVDVEMSPCQLTSRIKQAIGSVQTFVQRCFLNLEEDVQLSEAAADEWKWMKSYRVWEANRKVFLYPENWIEPDLRDDKTPFFKTLQSELVQSDISHESAEEAFLRYLEKLDQVARLEIAGLYHHTEGKGDDAIDALHVIGRTMTKPYLYFHRTRVDGTAWTPWQKIDLDIEGDHLIPLVYNRRLHLFWAVIEEKTDEDQSDNMGDHNSNGKETTTHLEIRLAWSELKNGKWTAKRITQGRPIILKVKNISFKPPYYKHNISWRAEVLDSGELKLLCNAYSVWLAVSDNSTLIERVKLGEFRFTGCGGGKVLTEKLLNISDPSYYNAGSQHSFPDLLPSRTSPDFMSAQGDFSFSPLRLLTGQVGAHPTQQELQSLSAVPVLEPSMPFGEFRLTLPYQHGQYTSQDSLFFEDERRTFLITPYIETTVEWTMPDKVHPNIPVPIERNPLDLWISGGAGGIGPIGGIGGVSGGIQRIQGTDVAGGLREAGLLELGRGIGGDVLTWAEDAGRSLLVPTYHHHLRYRFEPFYHPYVCAFVRQLGRSGADGLLRWSKQDPVLQLASHDDFAALYHPTENVGLPYPVEDVDFSLRGAYSAYNWEIFFHAPLLVADRLSKNQRFEEAQQWFHTIFDPTTGSDDPVPQRFWKVRPFYENTDLQPIDEQLSGPIGKDLADQIAQWRKHPFKPHLIARMRPLAYQKTVVMKYIENLINWGDQLFRRDTIESINEATQLYLLAADILGPRPQSIPKRMEIPPKTYLELEPLLDDFSNALVKIESWTPGSGAPVGGGGGEPLLLPSTLYFCIPPNDKLLGFWDTVADRLFKIRHCMNIEGVVRQLPLFEPPIDPALLVKAAAAGVDFGAVLSELNAPPPHYRFNVLIQKANELCAEVKTLGGALLAALEKKDAEGLALLRSTHEIQVLSAVRQVKEQQIAEAKETLGGLRKTREMVNIRHQFYKNISFMNAGEIGQITLSGTAAIMQAVIEGIMAGAAGSHPVPTQTSGAAGWAGSPVATFTTIDGTKIGNSIEAVAKGMNIGVILLREAASVSGTMGGYQRRWDEWKMQEKVSGRELDQIDKQIGAAELRVAIAELELENHSLQIENAREVDIYMRDKFTNQELYDWMVAQISAVYFQSYQLAYDTAKKTEKAFRFERGLTSSSFVQFGAWDSLKKGLLAGESLSLDLKRMEMAWLDQNRREYEVTRNISLLLHDPEALIALRETGQCYVELPETLFDMDFPGHYMRRIKNVALSIPCVTGPYTSINATLTLLANKIRVDSIANDFEEETHFLHNFAPLQSIATSHGQNDSGLFELDFRDERYLPFEGAGAVSRWRVDMPQDSNAFDLETVADVIFHIRYTAREGGDLLKAAAKEAVSAVIGDASEAPLTRMLSARHELPLEWHKFLHTPAGGPVDLPLDLGQERFPFLFRNKDIQISKMELLLKLKPEASADGYGLALAPAGSDPTLLTEAGTLGGLVRLSEDIPGGPGAWTLTATPLDSESPALAEIFEDIFVVCHYSVQELVS